MIVIDTNALLVYIIGLIDVNLVGKTRRDSLYDKDDFYYLAKVIQSPENICVVPNIWTELDNLLNQEIKFNYKYQYFTILKEVISKSSEKYLATRDIFGDFQEFVDLGVTDSAILTLAKDCKLLITADSKLADYAKSNGIKVLDLVAMKNEKLRK